MVCDHIKPKLYLRFNIRKRELCRLGMRRKLHGIYIVPLFLNRIYIAFGNELLVCRFDGDNACLKMIGKSTLTGQLFAAGEPSG